MTIKQLRAALAKLDPAFDNRELVVWLPGSIIELGNIMVKADGMPIGSELAPTAVMIEGNLREGSALGT